MKITGYKLREAIKDWELRRDAAVEAFDGSLSKFTNETKDSPLQVAANIATYDTAIARLQAAQTMFNVSIQVDVDGEKFSLCEAVKRVGGAERLEKTWRNAMKQLAPARSYSRNLYAANAAASVEEAVFAMTQSEAREQTSLATKKASKLRSTIAAANATEVDITDLDPSLIP